MFLKSITLSGFRSFTKKTSFQFDPKFTLIIGPNSIGKTNLLEAIYFLSKGNGFRDKKTYELVSEGLSLCAVEAELLDKDQPTHLSIRLNQKDQEVRKSFAINKLNKTFKQYVQRTYNVVLFQPEDLLMVSGTPDRRRSYFDRVLTHEDYQYYLARHNFSRGLYKRNKILENQQEYQRPALLDLLHFWDKYLSEQALVLQKQRQNLVEAYNTHPSLNGMSFKIIYQQNQFIPSDEAQQLAMELKNRRTLSGPQLDDFLFIRSNSEDKVLSQFGSRSEQRLCVLWLKINELQYVSQISGQLPILLMDDIFSELDNANSERILHVAQNYQTIVTTAHLDILPLIEKTGLKMKGKTITLAL